MSLQLWPKPIISYRLIILTIVVTGSLWAVVSVQTTQAYGFSASHTTLDRKIAKSLLVKDDTATNSLDAPQVANGVITGRVTAQADGRPLEGVEVLVSLHGDGIPMWESYTDANGVYTITNLYPSNNYIVLFYPGINSGYSFEYYHDKIDIFGADPISVTAGGVTSGIDEALGVNVPLGKNVQVATSPALPNMILVSREGSAVPLYSWDSGLSWLEIYTAPWAEVGTTPKVALVPRTNPPYRARFIVAEPGDLYSPDRFKYLTIMGLYRSGDYGSTWAYNNPANATRCVSEPQDYRLEVSPADPHRLYLQAICDISEVTRLTIFFTSADGGLNWSEYLASPPTPVDGRFQAISPVLPNRIYHLYYTGWQQSDDNGQTWSSKNFPATISKLVLDGQNPQRLYGLQTAGFYSGTQSLDGGITWRAWTQQLCPTSMLQLMAHPTATGVLLMRCREGLYRSRDGGDSWQKLSSEVGASLAPDYGRPGRLLWVKDEALWASTDQGTTWTRLGNWDQNPRAIYLPSIWRP